MITGCSVDFDSSTVVSSGAVDESGFGTGVLGLAGSCFTVICFFKDDG